MLLKYPNSKPGFIPEEKPIVIKRYCAKEIIPNPDDEINDLATQIFQDLELKATPAAGAAAKLDTTAQIPLAAKSSTKTTAELYTTNSPTISLTDDGHNTPVETLETEIINSTAPLDKLNKTIKKGTRITKKSQIPRPTVDGINWGVTNDDDELIPSSNVREISSIILENVVEPAENLSSSLTHDVEAISPTSSGYGLEIDKDNDDDDDLIVQTEEIEPANQQIYAPAAPLSLQQLHSPQTTTTTATRQVTKNTRITHNPDGSSTQVIITEERKTNVDGYDIIVRETATIHCLPDGTQLPPEVHTSVITADNTDAMVKKTSSDIVGGDITESSPGFFQASSAASMKSKTSSTKSLENQITNKTFGSSSDSDIALHEPGIELSEDDDADAVDTGRYIYNGYVGIHLNL